ncbi:MAG: hypothetical protein PHV85_00975 [Desulfovibrionaceae bacterium]|nr:hypothetical protein [Desulfovibrionaceae bacterium]
MAASPLDLPVLVSQLPFVQKLANAEQARPEMERTLFAPLMAEHQKLLQERIQGVNKKERAEAVGRDAGSKGQQQAPTEHREKKPEDQETTASNASPWAGNIINVKI